MPRVTKSVTAKVKRFLVLPRDTMEQEVGYTRRPSSLI